MNSVVVLLVQTEAIVIGKGGSGFATGLFRSRQTMGIAVGWANR
jgi:hypothetical protein